MLASATKLLRQKPGQPQFRTLCTVAATRDPITPSPNAVPDAEAADPTSMDVLFAMQSRRRVYGSPALALEAVAMSPDVQSVIESHVAKQKVTARMLRKSAQRLEEIRAPDSMREKRVPKRGRPFVLKPMQYCETGAISQAVIRSPGTLAANTYVMSEARRCYPSFVPRSMLDFGSGIGVSLMAASRTFSHDPFGALSVYHEQNNREIGALDDASAFEQPEFLTSAVLVDHSRSMHDLATSVLRAEFDGRENLDIKRVSQLGDAPKLDNGYDIVSASYSLNEVVRASMAAEREDERIDDGDRESFNRDKRARAAENRLRKMVKSLWSRTAPGGLFVIVEDGTAAGFETVLFARDVILNLAGKEGDISTEKKQCDSKLQDSVLDDIDDLLPLENPPSTCPPSRKHAKVLAPCLHSGACPLEGSVTRHRLCRFEQRFNRPKFLREARPKPTGHEDEYFSYIVIQKVNDKEDAMLNENDNDMVRRWGRLIRAPLLRGKHIAIDSCTVDGTLERRVISKKNAPPGHYSYARRSRWGDIWPVRPMSKPQPLNF